MVRTFRVWPRQADKAPSEGEDDQPPDEPERHWTKNSWRNYQKRENKRHQKASSTQEGSTGSVPVIPAYQNMDEDEDTSISDAAEQGFRRRRNEIRAVYRKEKEARTRAEALETQRLLDRELNKIEEERDEETATKADDDAKETPAQSAGSASETGKPPTEEAGTKPDEDANAVNTADPSTTMSVTAGTADTASSEAAANSAASTAATNIAAAAATSSSSSVPPVAENTENVETDERMEQPPPNPEMPEEKEKDVFLSSAYHESILMSPYVHSNRLHELQFVCQFSSQALDGRGVKCMDEFSDKFADALMAETNLLAGDVQSPEPDSEFTLTSKCEPGWVIVDTACTLSLIGAETMMTWEKHLEQKYEMRNLKTDEVNVRFRGLSGESRAKEARFWPMMLGEQLGGITTAVVPGNVPCLMSLEAMKGMHMIIDVANSVVQVTVNGVQTKLPTKITKEGHLAINIWKNLKPKRPVFALVATDDRKSQPAHKESQVKLTPKEVAAMRTIQAIARDSPESTVNQAYMDRITSMVADIGLGQTYDTDNGLVKTAVLAYKPVVVRSCASQFNATHVLILAVHEGALHYPFGTQWHAISMLGKKRQMKQRWSLVMFIFANIKAMHKGTRNESMWKPLFKKSRVEQTGYVATVTSLSCRPNSQSSSSIVHPPGLEPPSAEGSFGHSNVQKSRQGEVSCTQGTSRTF